MTKPIFKTCFILFVGIAQALADDQLNVDLFSAVYEKDIQAVDNLLGKGANVDAKNRLGFTPLMLTGDPVMASYLIKRGAVVDF